MLGVEPSPDAATPSEPFVPSRPTAYDRERAAGIAALAARDLGAAGEHFARALDLAVLSRDEELADRAFCNLAAVAIELGDGTRQLPRLREILLRNRSAACAFLAAYNLAEAHQLERNHRKALFYCSIARDRAATAERPEWLASSLNRQGNLLVALHRLDQARASYDEASSLLGPGDLARRASIEQNLGYIDVLEQRALSGVRRLLRAARMQRRLGSTSALLHLDLAAGYLELGRARPARRHAERALELSRSQPGADELKNSLLIVAQARRACGDFRAAERATAELADLYPQAHGLAAIFDAVDVLPIVNLRA